MLGKILKLEVRGASHARAIRFALDGFPKGYAVDAAALAVHQVGDAHGQDEGHQGQTRRERQLKQALSGVCGDIRFDNDAGNDDPQQDGAQVFGALRGEEASPAQEDTHGHQQRHNGDLPQQD